MQTTCISNCSGLNRRKKRIGPMIDLTKTNETICIFGLLNEQQTQTEKEKNDHLFSLIAVADSIAAVIIITQL